MSNYILIVLTSTIFFLTLIIIFLLAVILKFYRRDKQPGKKFKKNNIDRSYSIRNDNDNPANSELSDCAESIAYSPDSSSDEDYIAHKVLRFCKEQDTILEKEFKLTDLALLVGTNRNYISRALNRALQLNFNQFKNYVRIYKTCNYFILNPNTDMSKLFEISRFSSFSSFNNSFDKHTHYSPHKWCRDVQQRLANGEKVTVYDYMRKIRIRSYKEDFL